MDMPSQKCGLHPLLVVLWCSGVIVCQKQVLKCAHVEKCMCLRRCFGRRHCSGAEALRSYLQESPQPGKIRPADCGVFPSTLTLIIAVEFSMSIGVQGVRDAYVVSLAFTAGPMLSRVHSCTLLSCALDTCSSQSR